MDATVGLSAGRLARGRYWPKAHPPTGRDVQTMQAAMRRHVDIRYRPDGFEAKCLMCAEWHPLTLDYWHPKHGMVRCKACLRAYHRAWQAGKSREEAWAEGVRECRRAVRSPHDELGQDGVVVDGHPRPRGDA